MSFDFQFDQHPLWMVILAGSLALSLLIFLFYYLIFFRRFAFWQKQNRSHSKHQPPVTIVIAARNEYLNLRENLPFLLNQDYPDFEILVVDDHSQDDSWDLLCAFKISNPHLKIVRLTDSVVVNEGKKFPLSVGIKEARHNQLLLTDADCRPTGPFWISEMIDAAGQNERIVLGYGKYYRRRSLLNVLIRFDTMHIAIQYFSAALSGFPYMGVGRNLSYSKELFLKSGGFTAHYKLSSGDDDLFVSANSNKHNTSVCFTPASFTFSEPKHKFKAWWYQKKRHLSTSGYYRFPHKIYLGLYHLNILLFPALVLTLLLLQYQTLLVAAIVLIKWTIQWIIFGNAAKKLKEKKLLLISPVLETILAALTSLIYITNIFNKPERWK
ncbi:MAG: glycosyl transferase family 2 [Bacteroidetes bacterium HGW-Bacteroidetes-6]|jgi:glycosyltransferase involved in cell wall biosynthesis|nr:MAG: glycosyl transferase family 2 [Bacteroidetes bacterium HGW-Bacteroidetes-6]